jgi:hypothetical protein
MKKLIEFRNIDKAIQEHADLFCEGNFSMAVRQLVVRGLNDNNIPWSELSQKLVNDRINKLESTSMFDGEFKGDE